MRRKARTDNNHHEVVRALRQAGIQVQDLSTVGGGCPDLLCGYGANFGPGHARNVLLEIKDGSKTPGRRPLTAAQTEWHSRWAGQVAVVTSPDEAVDAVLSACGVLSRGASGIKHSS